MSLDNDLDLLKRDVGASEDLLRKILAMQKKLYGDAHLLVASTTYQLSQVCFMADKYKDAIKILQQLLESQQKENGEDDPEVAKTLLKLSELKMLKNGGTSEVASLACQAKKILSKNSDYGQKHQLTKLARKIINVDCGICMY